MNDKKNYNKRGFHLSIYYILCVLNKDIENFIRKLNAKFSRLRNVQGDRRLGGTKAATHCQPFRSCEQRESELGRSSWHIC